MARYTKALIARNDRIQKVVIAINDDMGKEYADALGCYAAKHGNNWAESLLNDWWTGRDANFCYDGQHLGPLLRGIRNSPKHGPAFYDAFNGHA